MADIRDLRIAVSRAVAEKVFGISISAEEDTKWLDENSSEIDQADFWQQNAISDLFRAESLLGFTDWRIRRLPEGTQCMIMAKDGQWHSQTDADPALAICRALLSLVGEV